jgi:hypothetical protein
METKNEIKAFAETIKNFSTFEKGIIYGFALGLQNAHPPTQPPSPQPEPQEYKPRSWDEIFAKAEARRREEKAGAKWRG